MKKEPFYSYKPWLILSIFVLSLVSVTYTSVYAADPDQAGNGFDPWSSKGYRSITVVLPSTKHPVVARPQNECVPNSYGLVSHWPLDEAAGATTFVDVVGSINGTCVGDTCPSKSFGVIGSAFNFVAIDHNVISVPADVEPANTIYDNMANGDFSAGVWIRTTQFCGVEGESVNKVFFGRHNNPGTWSAWWLGCTEPGGVAVFRLRDSNKIYRQLTGTSKITDGQWHYLVGVRDAGSDKNYLYVDGKLEGMSDFPLYTGDFSSDMPITMGAYDEPTNYYLDGTIDEVVLYNRVMPANEIETFFDTCEPASVIMFLPMVVRSE